MIDRTLIDSFNLKSRDFAVKWINQIRKSPQLKQFHEMDEELLIEQHRGIYPLLSRTLDRGLDRSQVGDYFVKMGKRRLAGGFPISEVVYGLNISQKVVIEYIMTEFAPENPMRMYQSLGALTKVAEFYLLGSFYVTKGFLEETYKNMKGHDNVSDELLKKYFKDDFFFKDN